MLKEILLLHHSHLDVGYTHRQAIVWQIHNDFIDQALKLLEATSHWSSEVQPKWTCEVTAPVLKWLERSSDEKIGKFREFAHSGRLGVSGLAYNMSPTINLTLLRRQLRQLHTVEKKLGIKIKCVNQHDINGVPWALNDLMSCCQMELLIMAVNPHFGGVLPPRPGIFRWQGVSGREIYVMNGDHYSMFDQWTHSERGSIDSIKKGLREYETYLKEKEYPFDFAYLTTVGAPLCWDNAAPSLERARLIKRWNEEGNTPKLRYALPDDLLAKIKQIPKEALPLRSGEWSDYWSFGVASSASETAVNQGSKRRVFAAELLDSFKKSSSKIEKKEMYEDLQIFDEHTWGADNSMAHDSVESVKSQWFVKAARAYEGRAKVDYLLRDGLWNFSENGTNGGEIEGVLLFNPSAETKNGPIEIPATWHDYTHFDRIYELRDDQIYFNQPRKIFNPVKVPPYSIVKVPFRELEPFNQSDQLSVREIREEACREDNPATPEFMQREEKGTVEISNRWYTIVADKKKGRFLSLKDREGNEYINHNDLFDFAQIVREAPTPTVRESRFAFYERDMESERLGSRSCWHYDAKVNRVTSDQFIDCNLAHSETTFDIVTRFKIGGCSVVEQRVSINSHSPFIDITLNIEKEKNLLPEAYYMSFPLKLEGGWRGEYDNCEIPTTLEAEQLKGACLGWQCVNSYALIEDSQKSFLLYSPDAPMVQFGNFNFSKENRTIKREPNPRLLAWPLNNYWDTNFRASQEGMIELHYSFLATGDRATLYDALEEKKGELYSYPLLKADKREEFPLLSLSKGVRVIDIEKDSNRLFIMLFVSSNESSSLSLSLPLANFTAAYLCSASGERGETLPIEESTLTIPVKYREIVNVELELAESL